MASLNNPLLLRILVRVILLLFLAMVVGNAISGMAGPDAFGATHAAIGVVVIVLAWKFVRPLIKELLGRGK
jgi:hypothetical protein